MKYKKDDVVFYQNNIAKFVSYLTDSTVVIITELEPDFEVDVHGTCMGCMVGNSDNKLSCTCEDTEYVRELIEENTDPTLVPLIVPIATIYDKPIVIQTHEKEVDRLKEVKKTIASEIKKLKEQRSGTSKKVEELGRELFDLEKRKQDYAQLEPEMTLKEFLYRKSKSVFHMLYAENDLRSVVGGDETIELSFNSEKYSVKIEAYWGKSDWVSFEAINVETKEETKGTLFDYEL